MPTHPNGDAVLWNVRFPRVVMAMLVGAALGAAGAVMQGIFGNPLAEPAVIGVSAGAAVGACTVIVFELDVPRLVHDRRGRVRHRARHDAARLHAVAIGGPHRGRHARAHGHRGERGGGRDHRLLRVPRRHRGARADRVLAARQPQRQPVGAGRASSRRWSLVGLVGALRRSRGGSTCSRSASGRRATSASNVERLRLVAIVVVTLLVASGVAFAGIIAFVGLVVPHLVRMIIGPSHRTLVPASALGGALVLDVADLVARTAVDYADLRSACSPRSSAGRSSSGCCSAPAGRPEGGHERRRASWRRELRAARARRCRARSCSRRAASSCSLRRASPILDEVDLAVRAGEVLALVGPNGAGQVDAARRCSPATSNPTRGSVTIDGAAGRDRGRPTSSRCGAAVLLQQVDAVVPVHRRRRSCAWARPVGRHRPRRTRRRGRRRRRWSRPTSSHLADRGVQRRSRAASRRAVALARVLAQDARHPAARRADRRRSTSATRSRCSAIARERADARRRGRRRACTTSASPPRTPTGSS